MAPARGGVNPLLVLAGVVLIAAIAGVGIYAYSNSSKGSPGASGSSKAGSPAVGSHGPTGGNGANYPGSLVFSPATVGCDAPMTIAIKLPSSVKDADEITLRIDGAASSTNTVIEAGMTKEADGSWSETVPTNADCSIGAGLHIEQLVDASGKVLAEGSFTITGSATAQPTANATTHPTPKVTPTLTSITKATATIVPSTFSCSAAPVQVTQTFRLPASWTASTLITMELDRDSFDSDRVDSLFRQQSDGSWLYTTTDSSTDLCGFFDPGKHAIGFLASDGSVIVEVTFTVNP